MSELSLHDIKNVLVGDCKTTESKEVGTYTVRRIVIEGFDGKNFVVTLFGPAEGIPVHVGVK